MEVNKPAEKAKQPEEITQAEETKPAEETGKAESSPVQYHIRPLKRDDISDVMQIDREAFPTMWPPVNFHHELDNKLAHYLVAYKEVEETSEVQISVPKASRLASGFRKLFGSNRQPVTTETRIVISHFIIGFIGLWMMADEAHIINIAVRARSRGLGIGELLLIAGIDLATELKASLVTLEVRASNSAAKQLYAKYGFVEVGLRKAYYTDNKEDAVLMSTENFTSPTFQEKFKQLKEAHLKTLGMTDYK